MREAGLRRQSLRGGGAYNSPPVDVLTFVDVICLRIGSGGDRDPRKGWGVWFGVFGVGRGGGNCV